MQKKCKKICIYQKFVVILHRLLKNKEDKSLREVLKTTQLERSPMTTQNNRTGNRVKPYERSRPP